MLFDCSSGNMAAYDFCRTFFVFVSALDDLIDRDTPVSAEDAVRVNLELFETLSGDFWVENRERLLPLIRAGASAWLDSEVWKNRDSVLDRIASQVLKAAYLEVFFEVAHITGGWELRRACTQRWRNFDYDACPPPKA
jgi:hypothetical protein